MTAILAITDADNLRLALRYLRRAAEQQPTGAQHAAIHLALGAASIALGHESGEPAIECERTRTRLAASVMFPEFAHVGAANHRLEQQLDAMIEDRERLIGENAALRARVKELTHALDGTEAELELDAALSERDAGYAT